LHQALKKGLKLLLPETTDFKAIIKTLKTYCGSFWFENLNLYPYCTNKILKYIDIKYPQLKELYYKIFTAKNMGYWERTLIRKNQYSFFFLF
jgi:Tol biopolymer transport system component